MSVMKRGMPPGGVNPLPAKLSSQAFATAMGEHGSQAEPATSRAASTAMPGDVLQVCNRMFWEPSDFWVQFNVYNTSCGIAKA